jgi:hypothetical protein
VTAVDSPTIMIGAGDNIQSVSHFILTTQCTWVVKGEQLELNLHTKQGQNALKGTTSIILY